MLQPKYLPISEYQKRFFTRWSSCPTGNFDTKGVGFKITGALKQKKLKEACEVLIKEHEILHAQYNLNGTECTYGDFKIDDFYKEVILDNSIDIIAYVKKLLSLPFDLTKDNLLRIFLLSVSDETYYFVMIAHHIIFDAISVGIVFAQVEEHYNLLISNQKLPPKRSKLFTEAVKAGQGYLNEANISKTRLFWQDVLNNVPLRLDVPKKEVINVEPMIQQVYFNLINDELLGLRKLIKESRSTLYLTLITIYGIVIFKYFKQRQIVIACPIDVRPKGFTNTVGCFANVIPLLINVNGKTVFLDLIKHMAQQILATEGHEWYLLDDIIKDQRKIRNDFQQNYFNIVMNESNFSVISMHLKGLQVEVLNITTPPSQEALFDLFLEYDSQLISEIKFKLRYRTNIFSKCEVDGFVANIKNMIINCYDKRNSAIQDILRCITI